MSERPEGPGADVDLDEIVTEIVTRVRGRLASLSAGGFRAVYLYLLVGVVVLWLLTGLYQVGPGERGVVRQFGARIPGSTGPGLHYRIPWPIQQVSVVDVESVRTAEIGFRFIEGGPEVQAMPAEAQMLTGDENVVDIRAIVQYRVRDAGDYLFNVVRPDEAVKSAAEVALRGVVGRNKIDYVLVEARVGVENESQDFLQELLDSYGSGVVVLGVKLQEVDAPEEVRDAFQDVVRAREDRERLVREAEGYAADMVPRARGEKERLIREAAAYKEERILRAKGDAERFLALLAEYSKAPEVTRRRLYLETMGRILPEVEKVIVDPLGVRDVLPFLPLRQVGGQPREVQP